MDALPPPAAPSLLLTASSSSSFSVLLLLLFSYLVGREAAASRSCAAQHNKCRYDMSCDVALSLAEALCDLVPAPNDRPGCPRLCALALVALLDTRGAWGRGTAFRTCRCGGHPHCRLIAAAMAACASDIASVEAALTTAPHAPVDCALALLLCHSEGRCRLVLQKTMTSCRPDEHAPPHGCGGPLRSVICLRHLRLLERTRHGRRPLACYCSGLGACGPALYGLQEDFALPVLAVNSLSWKPLRATHHAGIAMRHLQLVINEAKCPAVQQALAKRPPERRCPSLTGRRPKKSLIATTEPPVCYFLGRGAGGTVGASKLLLLLLTMMVTVIVLRA